MRPSTAVALLAYSSLVMGVLAVAVSVDGCAAGSKTDDNNYAGFTAPTSTSTSPTPDATTPVSGDDEASSPFPGDETSATSGDDGGEDADGGADADDADDGDDGEAGPAPCAANQTCVDQAPSGWTGYVQLRIATVDAGAGACAVPYGVVQQAGIADPSGTPAKCATCSCGAPTSTVTCSSGFATLNYGCSAADTYTALPAGSCVSATFANGGTEAPSTTSTATCATVGGQMVGTPDAAASTPAIVCAFGTADGGTPPVANVDAAATVGPTCDSTQACATAIVSQAGPSGVCIYQSGIQTCPTATVFTEQHLVGASAVDTRGCACACGAAQCPADGIVEGFGNSGCTGTPTVTLDAGAKCVGFAFTAPSHFKYVQSKSDTAGGCEVDDAGPTGGVTVDTTTGVTLCCIP